MRAKVMNKKRVVFVGGFVVFTTMLGACSVSQPRMEGAYKYDPSYDAYYRSRIEAAYAVPPAPPSQQPPGYYYPPTQAPAVPLPIQQPQAGRGGHSDRFNAADSLEGRMADLESQMERVIAFNKSLWVQLQQALNYIDDTKAERVSARSSDVAAAQKVAAYQEPTETPTPQKVVLHQPRTEEAAPPRSVARQAPKAAPMKVSIKTATSEKQEYREEEVDVLSSAFSYAAGGAEPEFIGGNEKYQAVYDVLIRAESKAELARLDKFLMGHGIKERFKSWKGGGYRLFLGSFNSPEAAAERRAGVKGQTGLEPTIVRRLVGQNA